MLALLVAQNIAFYVIAALMVFAAIRVVTCKNVVHAALWLVLVLAGVAAQFIVLAAEFVAITQILVYLGAIVVLFLFGIMLTRAKSGRDENLDGPTPTKVGRPGIGIENVAAVQAEVGLWIPVFCIGGIKRGNLPQVLAAGARNVVIVSDLLTAPDIAAAVTEVKRTLSKD